MRKCTDLRYLFWWVLVATAKPNIGHFHHFREFSCDIKFSNFICIFSSQFSLQPRGNQCFFFFITVNEIYKKGIMLYVCF